MAKNRGRGAGRSRDGEERVLEEPKSDIPDFTPEQWQWLKERTLELEKDYVPTRTIIEGL